jgi:queuosine precursor transporter
MWVGLYIAAIVLLNWLFTPSMSIEGVTQWTTPLGILYISNIVVGFVFVLRDYAQREIGHKVLLATLLAGILTYLVVLLTNDQTIAASLAFASIAAFAVSEMTDWAIYSFTKWPLQQRILWSSLASVPLDTIIFQNLAGYFTPAAFATELVSKAIGVAAVWYLLRLRVGNQEAKPAVAN